MAAGLVAGDRGLDAVIVDQQGAGGTILQYPRRKLVMVQPVEIPRLGRLPRHEYTKEDLLEIWEGLHRDHGLRILTGLRVTDIEGEVGDFTVAAGGERLRARHVLLALGRRGSPRKLNVPGENLSKVAYRLIDAEAYRGRRVLVVGGGDSAVEAALGLAHQEGCTVTLSYRKPELMRIKQRNRERFEAMRSEGRIRFLGQSTVESIEPKIVRLREPGGEREIPNDEVFVLAGGIPPFDFLRKLGIRFGGEQGPVTRSGRTSGQGEPVKAPRPLSTSLFRYMMAVFWALSLGMGLAWVISDVRHLNADVNNAEQEYVDRQKDVVRDVINQLAFRINNLIDAMPQKQEAELRDRVDRADALARHLWELNRDRMPREQLIRLVCEALRPLRYDGNSSYYFVIDRNGLVRMNADRADLEGRDVSQQQDVEGRFITRDMVALATGQGEGVYRYLWTKPGLEGAHHAKTSYVRLFEPLGLVIGTGQYDADFRAAQQKEILGRIATMRYGETGYVFVNSYDGTALLIRSDRYRAGDNIWELEDPSGQKVIQAERRAVENPGGDFIEYVWYEPGHEEPVRKISFIQGIDRWQWMIGAGVHLDALDTIFAERRAIMQGVVRRAVLQTLLTFGLALILSTYVARRFAARIRGELDTLGAVFERAVTEHREIDPAGLGYLEFRGFADSMNAMIGERRQIEADLLKARNLESIGVLAGGIAHDFNNLLTAILGNISLARMDLPDGSESEQALAQAESVSQRARDLTQQLLAFAKGGAPIRSLEDLGSIIRESADFSLLGSSVDLQFDLQEDLYPAEVDAGQFSQVVGNLTLNASQAMPGGGRLTIRARNRDLEEGNGLELPAGPYVAIEFRDTGCGIAREHLDRIFDPYFTTKAAGTGLGLSSVYAIVKNHDGVIRVETEPGAGTTFRIWIPARRTGLRPSETQRPEVDALPKRVLLMDDDDAVSTVCCRMLERIGCEVERAENGERALEMYERASEAGRRYDVVIMDLTIRGGMGGQEAIQRLLEFDPAACAVVSSGYSNDPVMSDHRQYGFRAVIRKPYDVAELREVLGGLSC